MKDYKRSIQGAHLTLVNLSFWRLALPLLGALMFDVPGLIVGLALGFICHIIVRPYLSLHPLKVKQINDQSEFIKLKRWMVPAGSKPVEAECYEEIEKNASQQSKAQLKELAALKGFVTGYDYANFCLLDEQLWSRVERENNLEATVRAFHEQGGDWK